MPAAIKLDGAKNVHIKNVRTSGFENGILAKDASGLIEGYHGDPISLRDGSDFQIVDSRTSGLEVDNSVAELYDTVAGKLLRLTANGENHIINDIRYYASRVIDSTSQNGKEKWLTKLKSKYERHKKYLDLIGYGNTIAQLLRPIFGV